MNLFPITRNFAVFLVGMLISSLTHAAFTQVISFGDSLSDTGNVFAATTGTNPPAPYFNGRFSNGQVWNEALAISLGLTAPTPSLAGGTNFAWGGARTNSAPSVPSTATQVDSYITATGGAADPGALYTIWTGGNDIKDVATGAATPGDLAADANNVATLVNNLKTAGAQSILVLNVPNIGNAPLSAADPAGGTALSNLFNSTLATALAGINGVELVDVFTASNNIDADPAAFGLTNVTDKCFEISVPSICADPSKYLFWDELHPTTAGHALIADAALQQAMSLMAVPLPAALPLLISGLFGMGFFGRKRGHKVHG